MKKKLIYLILISLIWLVLLLSPITVYGETEPTNPPFEDAYSMERDAALADSISSSMLSLANWLQIGKVIIATMGFLGTVIMFFGFLGFIAITPIKLYPFYVRYSNFIRLIFEKV